MHVSKVAFLPPSMLYCILEHCLRHCYAVKQDCTSPLISQEMGMNSHIDIAEQIKTITDESKFLEHLRQKRSGLKSAVYGDAVRKLTAGEKDALQSQGNRAEDWDTILVVESFSTENICHNFFGGECILGNFSGAPIHINKQVSLPSGIYNSTILNSEIGSDSLVNRAALISGYCIESNCVVFECGPVTFCPESYMGNGVDIAVGNENECRAVISFAEMTIPIAEQIAMNSSPDYRDRYHKHIQAYVNECSMLRGIIGRRTHIRYGAKVENCYIGKGATIERAEVSNCTVLSSLSEPVRICGDAKTRNSCIQWGCTVDSFGYVENSILCEHSHVERHGKVFSSIIGPNTGIAEGEVTSGLLGPFIGFHHQALLIAALWPKGKGNVGYGANIGSNHTGKSPDQEIVCGEGLFFGLGVNIKFPGNYADSPYTIIATGVDTLPQKVCFPFSLINKPMVFHAEIPPAFNEIFPGWMLSDNIYAVMRNEIKYRTRDKATRMDITYDVFRPEIVSKMQDAKLRLENISEQKELYLSRDIQGLGKNFLREGNRKTAISAYLLFIEYYVLRGLFERAEILFQKHRKLDKKTLYGSESAHRYWQHQHGIFHQYGYAERSVVDNLTRFKEIVDRIADKTEEAKKKDDARGDRIIDDYSLYHTAASEDWFIRQMREVAHEFTRRIFLLNEAVI